MRIASLRSYYYKAWREGTRYDDPDGDAPELDPQLDKPVYRPGWSVRFNNDTYGDIVGTIWMHQMDIETGAKWYIVQVEIKGRGVLPFHVPEERISKRIE